MLPRYNPSKLVKQCTPWLPQSISQPMFQGHLTLSAAQAYDQPTGKKLEGALGCGVGALMLHVCPWHQVVVYTLAAQRGNSQWEMLENGSHERSILDGTQQCDPDPPVE